MLISTYAEVNWSRTNKNKYMNKGYLFTNLGDTFMVKVEDLTKGSSSIINVQCDYCGDVIQKTYHNYLLNRKNFHKDCCNKKECRNKKYEESMLANYGVKSPLQLIKVKNKIKNTNMSKYGVENVFQIPEIKEKVNKIIIEKYGVENVFQSEEIKEKIKKSNLKHFGVEYPMQSETVLNKMLDSKNKNGKNNFEAMFPIINGVAASKPQIELGKYLKGEINQYILGKYIDIVLKNEHLAIEYDGGGHTLDIELRKKNKDEFYKKEKEMEKRFMDNGWKFIRIKNEKDKKLNHKKIKNEIYGFINKKTKYLLINIS